MIDAPLGVDNVDVEARRGVGSSWRTAAESNIVSSAERHDQPPRRVARNIPQVHGGLKEGRWERSLGRVESRTRRSALGLGRIDHLVRAGH